MMESCDCIRFARVCMHDMDYHHPACKEFRASVSAKRSHKIIRNLLKAMDAWASDEDGVHPEACDAYNAAAQFILMPKLKDGE